LRRLAQNAPLAACVQTACIDNPWRSGLNGQPLSKLRRGTDMAFKPRRRRKIGSKKRRMRKLMRKKK
jgi:hypothetical protein